VELETIDKSGAGRVRIVEVGPRDGLQNEPAPVPTAVKLELIARLAAAGLSHIEATAFVSPKWVPQMADHDAVMRALSARSATGTAAGVSPSAPAVTYSVLVPNMRGLDAACAAGAGEVAVFAAASETFSRRNINCSIAESLERFRPIAQAAAARGVSVRGYVSCVVACPYEGRIAPHAVLAVARALQELGCSEISLGETLGVATPRDIRQLLDVLLTKLPADRLALHCHDTYGQAVANIYAGWEQGIRVFDSSVAGLGGCPYAPGAAGNVATEDVVYLFNGLGVPCGVDLPRVADAGRFICAALGREPSSKAARALAAKRPPPATAGEAAA